MSKRINVGPGKFGDKDKRRAFNKLENIRNPKKKIKDNKLLAFNKAVVPGKYPKLINVGPKFILDSKV